MGEVHESILNSVSNVVEERTEVTISDAFIKSMIYVVRGKQVMLDSDLAMLYQVETKRLNEAVKRNQKRFPESFCFQLTEGELESLRSQIATSKEFDGKGGRRYLPYVFTEQGIAMLSAVLRSDVAIQTSIKIMNTFIEMRKFIISNNLMLARINEIEVRQLEYKQETDKKFDVIFDYISEHEQSMQKIFYKGQIYDAFSLLTSLVSKAEKKLVLIDNYVDVDTLNILAKKKVDVECTIYTVRQTKLSAKDIKKFNEQYPTLKVKYTSEFHDRLLMIDDDTVYHIGASIKDAGKKCFGISKLENEGIVEVLLRRVEQRSET